MPRKYRQTSNRELFRAVNERIAELSSGYIVPDESPSFICECSRVGCAEQISAPLDVYAQVRATGHAYLIASSHQADDEQTILDHGSYRIVIAP